MALEHSVSNEQGLEIKTDQEKYLVQFPVGDWSDDGHGKCDYFFASSDKPVSDIREAHFKSNTELDIDIGSICSTYHMNYENRNIDEETKERLENLGYEFNFSDMDGDKVFPSSKEIFNIWIFALNKIDPELNLSQVQLPSIVFYGYDHQDRHLKSPGYGLFE